MCHERNAADAGKRERPERSAPAIENLDTAVGGLEIVADDSVARRLRTDNDGVGTRGNDLAEARRCRAGEIEREDALVRGAERRQRKERIVRDEALSQSARADEEVVPLQSPRRPP